MEYLSLGFELMLQGLVAVFGVLLVFYFCTKALVRIFPNKPSKEGNGKK